jgi:hypothetical protein
LNIRKAIAVIHEPLKRFKGLIYNSGGVDKNYLTFLPQIDILDFVKS